MRSRLGSTTHVSVMDADGACASVTCSNGSCSGVIVPGTGMHLNNMLGEEDLNPLGFHRHPPGARVPSMMAPTVVLRDGRARARARLGRLEPDPLGDPPDVLAVVDGGAARRGRRDAPRLHVRGARGGGRARDRPGRRSTRSSRAAGRSSAGQERNLYFGGVQAVARDPHTGELTGGGDPRRGGAAVSVG